MAKVYKKGSKGGGVEMLQRLLQQRGYQLTADGDYGPRTVAAVTAFQQAENGLVSDGVAGAKTIARLAGVTLTEAFIRQHITFAPGRAVNYIAIHYTAESRSTRGAAKANRDVFVQRPASADFVVDDEQTIQVNPDISSYYCWAVGDKRNPWTGGARLNGKATNRNTISIEMCSTLAKGTSAAAPNHEGWTLSDAVVARTLRLVRYLMMAYDIPRERVIRHYDVTGKLCPGIPGWNDGPLFDTAGKQTSRKSDSRKWGEFLAAI